MKRRQSGGFTLIEVMVAILLMAIVSLVAWRGLDSVSRADQHLSASTTQTRALMRVLGQLERDLALRATIELAEPVLPGSEPPVDKPLSALSLKGDARSGAQLEVIRTGADGIGLQRVRWWYEGGTVYRASGAVRSHFPLPAPKGRVAVLQQVSEFEMRYWVRGKGWRRLEGQRQEDPLGVELVLVHEGALGAERYRQVLGPFE
ncbi:PulJ/GspJ family protein [Pseudomonas sp. UFMG81]|jgi:general secretion pathway protein J|uniref:PulJ/GspJ family protein n=1 Tax=Pseudomonas sp. UFMG81 TaxID=2745936 RepID=UPI00188ED1C6|nr:prepilin-type N-terminal cleavage/methylation domain-containing protein [Pseudomonas sp. UFMG81]